MGTRRSHLALWLLAILAGGCGSGGRELLFPAPGASETKVQVRMGHSGVEGSIPGGGVALPAYLLEQVLFGLGLPMDAEVSITLGYVLKCNYELPPVSGNGSAPGAKGGGERRARGGICEATLTLEDSRRLG
jgi:hypothetical protein